MKELFTNQQGGKKLEDKDIVTLYWERNEHAIAETANKYGNYCYAIAYNILSNEEDAKESVNDTYMNAWSSMPPHRPIILSTFLGKITRFICLKKWRNSRAQKRGNGDLSLIYDELSECISSGENIADELESKEIASIINGFLNTLTSTDRRIFICRYWYFDSISSISRRFGFSESKVKSTLYRTRNKLLNKLKKEGVFN